MERLLARLDEPEKADIKDCVEQMLHLYQGPFLGDEEGEWAWRLRDRLRTKIARRLRHCEQLLQATGESGLAARLLERISTADPERPYD